VRAFRNEWFFHSRAVSDSVVRRILSFGQLPVGWHYGAGVPAPQHVIERALMVYARLEIAGAQLEAFPETMGGILVSGYHDLDTVDILCRVDGLFDIFHERDDNELLDEKGVNFSFVVTYLQELSWRPLKSYDFSTLSISATKRTGSRVWPFKSQMMDVQLSIPPARLRHPTANVHTFARSTAPAFQATPRSFSASMLGHSPMATP
jgi:hypothetical protein